MPKATPDAAFTAADVLGIYMEPELPFWGTIAAPGEEGYNEAEQNYLIELGDKMLDTFGNHPSFVMFSLGNELWGSPERLGEILRHYKERDSRHLYTQGCNNFQHFPLMVPEDDYYVGVRLSKERLLRGSFGMCDAPLGHVQTERPSTMHQYDDVIFPKQTEGEDASDTEEIEIQYGTGVKKVQVSKTAGGLIPTKPVVTHEIGQYEVYPDFREIDKPGTSRFSGSGAAQRECCARRTSSSGAAAHWRLPAIRKRSRRQCARSISPDSSCWISRISPVRERRWWECWTHSWTARG